MTSLKYAFLGMAMGLTATAALAQTTAPAPAGEPAGAVTVALPSAEECAANFAALDLDQNGFLSESEAPDLNARARVESFAIDSSGISQDEYLRVCAETGWTRPVAEEGAPFEGANSFTEAQAKDRAAAAGVSDVSALAQDDLGIWRGEGVFDGAKVNLAVDYKGNVVTTTQ